MALSLKVPSTTADCIAGAASGKPVLNGAEGGAGRMAVLSLRVIISGSTAGDLNTIRRSLRNHGGRLNLLARETSRRVCGRNQRGSYAYRLLRKSLAQR